MVFLGCDHGGFRLKEKIKEKLRELNISFADLGTFSEESVDYPDFAFAVAEAVASSPDSRGILVCTTGVGSCVAANKVRGIRAALCYTPEVARRARWDVDANILCLGGGVQDHGEALEIVSVFLNTPFSGEERHKRRINKIAARER